MITVEILEIRRGGGATPRIVSAGRGQAELSRPFGRDRLAPRRDPQGPLATRWEAEAGPVSRL